MTQNGLLIICQIISKMVAILEEHYNLMMKDPRFNINLRKKIMTKAKKKLISKSIIEALKELGRIALIAAVPIIISGLESGSLSWEAVSLAAIIAVLRAVDKFMHKFGVKKGLTRF